MTRLTYGADTQGPTIIGGRFAGGVVLTFWTAATAGTQITDLLNGVGGAVTTITSNADGTVPQFSGPVSGQGSNATPGMWVDGGGAERLFYTPQGGGGGGGGAVSSVFTRTGAVVATSGDYTVAQVTGAAALASPALTGTPTVPTASPGTNTTQAASTAYADAISALDLKKSSNLSDVADAGTSRLNLHVATLVAKATQNTNRSLSGLTAVDGFTPSANDLILLTGQTTSSQNGVWRAQSGSWTRPTDFPSAGVLTEGRLCFVTGGSTFDGTLWVLESTGSITIDTTAQVWELEQVVTQSPSDNSTNPASTAYADNAVGALNSTLGSLATLNPTGTADASHWLNGAGAYSSIPGAFFFPTTGATVSTSFSIHVPAAITIGLCTLQGAPTGTNLVVVLQQATTIGGTYSTVQSLTITSGSTTPVTATAAVSVAAGNFVRVNCTAAGGGTAALFQAEYA